MYASNQKYDQALVHFSMAIDLAKEDLINMDPEILASYYMHRAAVYEAIGCIAQAKRDHQLILEADPNVI